MGSVNQQIFVSYSHTDVSEKLFFRIHDKIETQYWSNTILVIVVHDNWFKHILFRRKGLGAPYNVI